MNSSQQYMAEATMAVLLMERLIEWRYSGNYTIVKKEIDYPQSAIDHLQIDLHVLWEDEDYHDPNLVKYTLTYCPAQHTPDINFVADNIDVTYPTEWRIKPFKGINI